MSAPKDPRFRLQLRLQLGPSAVVRPRSRSYIGARQAAYGTAVNRQERDHDGLAVWGPLGADAAVDRCPKRADWGAPARWPRASSGRPLGRHGALLSMPG